jgi:hypothetical protein
MATELPDVLTPLVKEDLARAMWEAWIHVFGAAPKKESIWVLLAQVQLETGLKACHCWNLGNVKSSEKDGLDYCFFACNEILKTTKARAMATAAPDTAKVTKDRNDGTSIIWFYPKHPACRFRAFSTLLDGAIDYIGLLNKRFSKSWPAVLAGDPAQFAHLLKVQGYYTADESVYVSSVKACFRGWAKLNVDYTTQLNLTEDQKTRISNLVALTMVQSLDSVVQAPFNTDDESNGAETIT